MKEKERSQKDVQMQLLIIGYDNWHEAVPATVEYRDKSIVSFDQYIEDHVKWNSNMTPENVIVSWFVQHDFVLEEAVIETVNEPLWGKMKWIKNHSSYNKPPKDEFKVKDAKYGLLPLSRARFRLTNRRIVKHDMFSIGGGGFLHKSFIYHKVVFSPKETNGNCANYKCLPSARHVPGTERRK